MTMFSDPKQDALNEAHIKHPEPGDYWSEMFCPVARILMVDEAFVLIQRLTGYGGKEVSADDPKPHLMTRRRFKNWLSYQTIPGTWAQVSPKLLPLSAVSPDEGDR